MRIFFSSGSLVCCTFASIIFATIAFAQPTCYQQAQSHNEQIYCEVIAALGDQVLPKFNDFKRNDDVTQFLLLKTPAKRIGVDLVMPSNLSPAKVAIAKERINFNSTKIPNCALRKNSLKCNDRILTLVANVPNGQLNSGALLETNRLALPYFEGDIRDQFSFANYILEAYQGYLEGMIRIGLGEYSLSLEKFHFLFHDLRNNRTNFAARFETMYTYLKRDKKSIVASSNTSINEPLDLQRCHQINTRIITCAGQRNYIFVQR